MEDAAGLKDEGSEGRPCRWREGDGHGDVDEGSDADENREEKQRAAGEPQGDGGERRHGGGHERKRVAATQSKTRSTATNHAGPVGRKPMAAH